MMKLKDRAKTWKKVNWVRVIFWVMVITLVSLWIVGILGHLADILNSEGLQFKIGKLQFTPYLIFKSLFILITMLWLVGRISALVEASLRKVSHLDWSDRALVTKILSIVLYLVSFLIVLSVLGIDLTAISVIGGALGIGIGFGLQKIASNFISGIILLFEKSINEGDLIDLGGGTVGNIRRTSARYTLIETANGKEIMIPNEDFITSRVTNSTYSDRSGRVDIDISIAYESDPVKAKQIILEVANAHPLCSRRNEPKCFLLALAESGLNFKLLVWMDDILEGTYGITNDILFEILKRFKEEGISIPYPHTDITITKPIKVVSDDISEK